MIKAESTAVLESTKGRGKDVNSLDLPYSKRKPRRADSHLKIVNRFITTMNLAS